MTIYVLKGTSWPFFLLLKELLLIEVKSEKEMKQIISSIVHTSIYDQ